MRLLSRFACYFFLFAAFSQPAMSQEETVSWTDQIRLYGDFRKVQLVDAPERDYNRMQLDISFKF